MQIMCRIICRELGGWKLIVQNSCLGLVSSNCYLIGDGKEAVLIDAGARLQDVQKLVDTSGMTLKMIFLTHCHFDHIAYADDIREHYGVPVAIHQFDAPGLQDPMVSGGVLFRSELRIKPADILVSDGESYPVGDLSYRMIHTPGHSKGGMCILAEDHLFCGDTLFQSSIGRTDLAGGNYDELIGSIKEKLLTLDENIVVYPGHGPASTIGTEKKSNPFLR